MNSQSPTFFVGTSMLKGFECLFQFQHGSFLVEVAEKWRTFIMSCDSILGNIQISPINHKNLMNLNKVKREKNRRVGKNPRIEQDKKEAVEYFFSMEKSSPVVPLSASQSRYNSIDLLIEMRDKNMWMFPSLSMFSISVAYVDQVLRSNDVCDRFKNCVEMPLVCALIASKVRSTFIIIFFFLKTYDDDACKWEIGDGEGNSHGASDCPLAQYKQKESKNGRNYGFECTWMANGSDHSFSLY